MPFGLFQSAPTIAPTDFGQSNLSGGMQGDAAGLARQQALGLGVSPADIQMRAGLMQAQKANAAQAVSTRGNFGLAGAAHAAQAGNAGLQQSVLNSSAQLRAQEQDRALQTYLAAATQKRAGDLQAAGLSQQEAISQAQMEQNAQSANQGMSSKLFGMGIGALEGGLTGGASIFGSAAGQALGGGFSGGTQDAGSVIGGYGGGAAGQSVSGGAGAYGAMVSDERAKQEAYVQGAQAGATEAVRQFSSTPTVHDVLQQHFGNRIPTAGGASLVDTGSGYMPLQSAPAGTPLQEPDAGPRMASGVISVQKSPYVMYDTESGQPMQEASDARAKQPQAGASNAANAFMDALEPRAFTWKDPSVAPNPQAAQGQNLGVYAQDVERSPFGSAIVQQDPSTGLKTLDIKALVGALAASAGETHRQQQAHEQRLAALEAALGRRQ